MMTDIALTSAAIIVASGVVWLSTRRDAKVMTQWRRPFWPLARIAVLFVGLHLVLVAANLPLVNGYVFLITFVLISLSGMFLNPLAVLFAATIWLFYEWVFWFPSRDELVLGNPCPTPRKGAGDGRLDGLIGVAVSDLTPVGQVLIGSETREARVGVGFVSKGELVEVESCGAFELIVKRHEAPNDQPPPVVTASSSDPLRQNQTDGHDMTTFISSLEKLATATSPSEYLEAQRTCLAVAVESEVVQMVRAAEPASARRLDLLQILYWLTPPVDRVSRFQRLYDEAAHEDREFPKALLFRAITENTVHSSHPERLEQYLESVRDEFAKSLFGS